MQTSNFRISGKNPNAVAISRGIPSWYKGKRLIELAPSRELMKVKDPGEYAWRYQSEVLAILDAQEILAKLDDNSILLCWEKPGEDCHRRLVPIRNDGPGRNRGRRYRLSDVIAMRDSFQKLV